MMISRIYMNIGLVKRTNIASFTSISTDKIRHYCEETENDNKLSQLSLNNDYGSLYLQKSYYVYK